jgi:hypothetical protein
MEGHFNPDGSKFCAVCGGSLVDSLPGDVRPAAPFDSGSDDALVAPAHHASDSLAAELQTLSALHAAGELSDDEYAEAKHDLLVEHGAAHATESKSAENLAGSNAPAAAGVTILPPPPAVATHSGRESARRKRHMRRGLTSAAAVAMAVLVTLILVATVFGSGGASTDSEYLGALKKKSLLGTFANDATAVAHAKGVCAKLERGASAEGSAADEVGVTYNCKTFAAGFHVLEQATVDGAFVLNDSDPSSYFPGITDDGTSCTGAGGYSDIGEGTVVTVKTGNGKLLTQTSLGPGSGGTGTCFFSFSFDVKEGEDQYVVSVGDRGELSYSFTDLKTTGVMLSLGG